MDEKEVFRRIDAAENGCEILNLTKCGLRHIPVEVFRLTHLKELHLRYNRIEKIPGKIISLENLQYIDIANNGKIKTIPPEIGGLEYLSVLQAGGNSITQLPPEIKYNKNLIKLSLTKNFVESLPPEIGELRKIDILAIRKNLLIKIPDEIGNLTRLTSLMLDYNRLSKLPSSLTKLKNLTLIDIQGNNLGIPNMIVSDVYNPFKIISYYFEHCNDASDETNSSNVGPSIQSLETLDLFDLEAKDASEHKNIKIVDLTQKKLNHIPHQVFNLTDIEQLHLEDNDLTIIPNDISRLGKLRFLDVGGNSIAEITANICLLKNLTTLFMPYNKIQELPQGISQLELLMWISLDFNRLRDFPLEMCAIQSLRHINMGNNLVARIPDEIGNLKNLKKLYLQNNKIQNLPFSIMQLENLEILDLSGNPLPIPLEILAIRDQPRQILDYYFKTRLEATKPLNEAKVLILGQGAVGKTSLIKRLLDNSYNPHEHQTDGINIRHWHINPDGEDIRLNIWDFGGQEIMHATHQFFLTKRSLYVLVLDSRLDDQENRVEYWLQIIQSFGGDSPVILVCNKCDERCLDLNWKRLGEKYPSIRAFVKRVSCKTGENIDELRSVIETEAARLEHIHDPLILTWFGVKSRLERMAEDYISYRRYEAMCEEENIPDDISRETLIGFLHDLGIVLHFKDHPILEDTNVLNPEWVTRGVYKILNSHILFQNRGRLDRRDLSDILDPEAYPRNRHQFIIDMMRQFELCFDFEGGDRFLVPDLLQKEEPDTGDWTGSLGFQYRYEILPGSVISRFIVRMNAFISKRTYWKNGVVLRSDDGKNRALVRADIEDRTVSICVNGREATRREFLAVIRADFRKIHATIPGLAVTEIVTLPDRPDIVVEYQYLKDLEEMGEESFIPPGLKQRVNVKQLLNGVESEEVRQSKSAYPGIGNVTIYGGDINMGDNINIKSGQDTVFGKDQATASVKERTENLSGNFTGSAIVTGDDNNTVSVNYQKAELPQADSVDMASALAELKKILAELGAPDAKKIDRALEDAEDELTKPEPDKDEVGGALERALKYSEKADKFRLAVDKLKPHVLDVSAWLGENWHKLIGFVGLS